MDEQSVHREQVINWVNELSFADTADKTDLLNKLKECLIYRVPFMIEECLDNIMMCSLDKSSDVRKLVVIIIEDICKVKIECLPKMLRHLITLLSDVSVVVQKRVIQAANVIYKNALIWICSTANCTDEIEQTWIMLNELKLNILNMIDSDNEGIRTNSIKFLEGIIIIQTYTDDNVAKKEGDFSLNNIPFTLKFAKRRNLEEESMHIFDLLVKYHNSEHISAVNLMACMTALFEVAKARPKFMSQVMQAFRELHSTLPPTLSQSQVNSVKKHMKMQVINLIRYTSSLDMIPQLIQLLSDFGMSNTAIKKFLPKDKRLKRILDTYNGDGPAKRARIDSPQANSQGSDSLSNDENLMDSNKVTEKSLLEGLENIDNVINLVLATMDRLPNEIPGNFKTVYEPIPKTGTLLPKSALAKLLLNIIKNDPVEKRPFAEVAVKADEEKKSNLKSALAKLGTAMQESKNDSNDEEMESRTDGEIAREKEISKNLPKDKMICPPTPTIPKLKQRAKSIKLTEVTKPISTDMKEKLIYGAVERILNSERASIESGATNQRIKMITSFAVSYGLKVRELVLGHILKDLPSQIDLALYWLFEEYSYMQGFNRSAGNLGSSKPHDKLGQNYNQLFCALVTHIADLNDPSLEIVQENLWRRVYLESPYVTDDGLQFLKHLCMQENKSVSSMKLLRDLAIYQPPKSAKYIHRFLTLVTNPNNSIREQAIEHVVFLYQACNESSKKAIDKFASLYLGFIAMPQPPADLFNHEETEQVNYTWNDELYKICVQLYLSLMGINPELLGDLWRVYVNAGAEAKRCVLRLLEPPVSKLGPENPSLLALIDECPKGAETLITRVIHILTEKNPPTEELVNRVRELYSHKVSDVRFLIPVITGLTKKEIYAALPKLIKLNPAVVREVFNKLLGITDKRCQLPVTPAELLIALHLIDPAKAELKYVIKATSLCFSERQSYTPDVLGIVLQQLSEQPQLPVLLMRSVLQALTLHPAQMSSLVINLLQDLIKRQIWENKVVWEGFLKCCQRLIPQSVSVLIVLPAEQLKLALATCSDLYTALVQALPAMTSPPSYVSNVLEELSTADGTRASWPPSNRESSFSEPLPPGME